MSTRQPNIVLIMSDQHNPRVMGCAGDTVVRTPSLDALAASGTRFEHAYCGSPLCVPSRMTFMTSRHCSDIDVWTNSCMLASDIPAFAHSLGAAGYETVLGGRMHFVGPDQRHGFHRRLIGDVTAPEPGGPGPDLGTIPAVTTGQSAEGVKISGPGRTAYQAYDDAVLAACQTYLQEQHERPFCLVMGLVLPHCPFIAPKALFDYYYERVAVPTVPPDGFDAFPPMRLIREKRGYGSLTPQQIRSARAAYYALVEYCDDIVGRLLLTLQEAGLNDDTIVIYTSDHGESAGENGLWCKTSFNEGSVGVPLIFSGPGIPTAQRCTMNASLLDLGPTMVDLAGATPAPRVAGRSLLPLLQGDPPEGWSDEIYAEMIGYPGTPSSCMVKQGPWKLIHNEGFEPLLFNLRDDPDEFENVAGETRWRHLREQLHQRALRGWNPGRALQVIERRDRDCLALVQWRRAQARHDADHWYTPPGANVWPEE